MAVPYEAEFKRSGAEFDIPWWMMAGMAHETSHFNTNAVGPTDDHGVMQVICANVPTCGLNNCSELHDAAKNIRCAARLLRRHFDRVNPLVDDFDDRMRFVMLANNMGWGNVGPRLTSGPREWSAFKAKYPGLNAKYQWVEKMYARAQEYRPWYSKGHWQVLMAGVGLGMGGVALWAWRK